MTKAKTPAKAKAKEETKAQAVHQLRPPIQKVTEQAIQGILKAETSTENNDNNSAMVDYAQLANTIEEIAKGVVTLDSQLQKVLTGIAVQVVSRSEPRHGLKLANDLMSALGKGIVKRGMVISWLTKNAPIKYDKDDSKFVITSKLLEKRAEFQKDRINYVNERNAKPYSSEEFRAVRKAEQEFDFNKLLKALINKAETAKKSGKFKTVDLGSYEDIKAGNFAVLSAFVKVEPKPDAPKPASTLLKVPAKATEDATAS